MSQDIQRYPRHEATPVGHSGSDRLMAEPVAVLGTGIMGAPMARNLLKAGFQVRVWNRTPDKARALAAEGADPAETPADAVREAAFVITMLTDAAAVLVVMGQAAESVADGAVWLQTSMVGRGVKRGAGFGDDQGDAEFLGGELFGCAGVAAGAGARAGGGQFSARPVGPGRGAILFEG